MPIAKHAVKLLKVIKRCTGGLDNATALFEGLGASAVDVKHVLDRHWRNARTVASHNPVVFKSKVVGDYEINGTEPIYVWAIGTAPTEKDEHA